jgi:hypothetical protein
MPRDRFRASGCFGLVFASTLLIALQATPAFAWDGLGHRVIAGLAERHLTDRAKLEIKALLEPGKSLADASTWADEVRGRMRHTSPWHYVDVPLDEPRYDDKFAADDARHGYVVPKFRELRALHRQPASHDAHTPFALGPAVVRSHPGPHPLTDMPGRVVTDQQQRRTAFGRQDATDPFQEILTNAARGPRKSFSPNESGTPCRPKPESCSQFRPMSRISSARKEIRMGVTYVWIGEIRPDSLSRPIAAQLPLESDPPPDRL